MKNYFYPEFLKLAAYAASNEFNRYNQKAYPDVTDVYVEFTGDLKSYNPISKTGEMFFLIETPKNNRITEYISYEIIDDVIHYGLGNRKNLKTPLTPELIKELKEVEMENQYFFDSGDGYSKNVYYMTIGELKEALCKIIDRGADCFDMIPAQPYIRHSEFYKYAKLKPLKSCIMETPTQEVFEEMKLIANRLWNTYSNEFGYVDQKTSYINSLENIQDNAMVFFRMFDHINQTAFKSNASAATLEYINNNL